MITWALVVTPAATSSAAERAIKLPLCSTRRLSVLCHPALCHPVPPLNIKASKLPQLPLSFRTKHVGGWLHLRVTQSRQHIRQPAAPHPGVSSSVATLTYETVEWLRSSAPSRNHLVQLLLSDGYTGWNGGRNPPGTKLQLVDSFLALREKERDRRRTGSLRALDLNAAQTRIIS